MEPPEVPVNIPSEGSFPTGGSSISGNADAIYFRRLLLSIAVSLLLNLLFLWIAFTWNLGKNLLIQSKLKSKAVQETPQLVLIERQPEPPRARQQTFLETDASQAVKEKPKDAAFYSEHNTVATQTTSSEVKSIEIPKTDGKNTKIMATENVLPVKASPSTPPPQPEPSKVPRPSEKQMASLPPQPNLKPLPDLPKVGDYVLLKSKPPPPKPTADEEAKNHRPQMTPQESPRAPPVSQPTPRNTEQSPSRPTPSSNREVIAAMSKLDGGVNKIGQAVAFNSAESPFASYDKKIIGKIGVYWHYLVQNKFYGETVGEVEVSFKILSDGKIADLHVSRNSANVVLAGWCIQAIEQSAPFPPFPESIKAIVGNQREGTITFAY